MTMRSFLRKDLKCKLKKGSKKDLEENFLQKTDVPRR
jgi:hypothetical protein